MLTFFINYNWMKVLFRYSDETYFQCHHTFFYMIVSKTYLPCKKRLWCIERKFRLRCCKFNFSRIKGTHLLRLGRINWLVCWQDSTQDLRSFLILSRSSGQSLDWPICISRSLNNATCPFTSIISWNEKNLHHKRLLTLNFVE